MNERTSGRVEPPVEWEPHGRARAREVVVFSRLGLATRVARMSDELFVAMRVAATGRSKNDGSLPMDYRQVT